MPSGDNKISPNGDSSVTGAPQSLLPERLHLIFDNVSDMLCLLRVCADGRFRVEEFNRAAFQAMHELGLHFDRDTLLGMPLDQLSDLLEGRIHPNLQFHLGMLNVVVETGESCPLEIRLGTPDDPTWVEGEFIPVVVEEGKVSYVLCSGRDVTAARRDREERSRLEAQLRHVQKLESLGVLAGGVAHDFNNILTAIIGYTDLAKTSIPADHPALEHLREVVRASRRAAELCKQMLAYSGKGRVVTQWVQINDVVKEMASVLEVAISKKAVVRLDFDPTLPGIEADPQQIQQVALNLIMNASDALGKVPGIVTLSTRVVHYTAEDLAGTLINDHLPGGEYVVLEVADTGCGMDEATRARIFDPFFSTKFPGRGLGLASVLGIVRGHKGAIEVESERGSGTRIRVLFPVARRRAHAATVPVERPTGSAGGAILFIDDEAPLRMLGRELLTAIGHTVITAEDGQDGVEIFRARRDEIALVIMDLTMPRMGGEEAFVAIREIDPGVPILISSGYDAEEAGQRLQQLGLNGFIQKPYQLAALAAAVNAALGQSPVAEVHSER